MVRNLDRFAPQAFPLRPEIVTYDDNQLVEAYQAKDHGKLGKAASEQLRYFAAWRVAVWRVEGIHEGNLIVLAAAIGALELGGDHHREVTQLRAFVRQHWRCSLPDPVPGNRLWVERWAVRFAQNRRVLPLYMRTMTKPPLGAGGQRSGVNPQQYLDYGAENDDDRDENEPGF